MVVTPSTRRVFRRLPNGRIIDAADEFNNAVMYFDTDGSGVNVGLTINLGEDVLLNEHIVFHRGTAS